jgi:hypothetical protein
MDHVFVPGREPDPRHVSPPAASPDADQRSAALRTWFGSSVVADRAGNPLVLYHGTPTPGFSQFDLRSIGRNEGVDRDGFFFTNRPDEAAWYAQAHDGSGRLGAIYPVHIRIERPYTVDQFCEAHFTTRRQSVDGMGVAAFYDSRRSEILDQAKHLGCDGVYFAHDGEHLAVPFSPYQIKSALGNQGTFHRHDPRIDR